MVGCYCLQVLFLGFPPFAMQNAEYNVDAGNGESYGTYCAELESQVNHPLNPLGWSGGNGFPDTQKDGEPGREDRDRVTNGFARDHADISGKLAIRPSINQKGYEKSKPKVTGLAPKENMRPHPIAATWTQWHS